MRTFLFSLLFICCNAILSKAEVFTFPFAGSVVVLLDSTAAAKANGTSDAYSRALTPFDLQIRLGIAQGAKEADYLAMAASQVRNWPLSEQQDLQKSFAEIELFLKTNNIQLKLPPTIQLIKTAGKEEFGADGYTRGNSITLFTHEKQRASTHLIAHELFHVYSRHNESKRDEIYSLFGFKKNAQAIDAAKAMQGRIITNPDCPVVQHYISLKKDGKAIDVVLQLYSKNDYKEHYTLGDYMNLGLLEVAGAEAKKVPVLKDGKGMLYELDQMPDLFAHIGTNTSYILHPEELAAEHFAMWIVGKKVPQPEYFEALKKVLAK